MKKLILILIISVANLYCDLLELNSKNFPNIKENRIFELSLDTMKLVRDNQKILAQYKQSTEYFVVSDFPKISMITRLSDKSDASIAIYFDENVSFKTNSRILAFYLNDGKLYVDEDSLLIRDFYNLESKVFDMILKYRQHLLLIKEKFNIEEKNIFIALNNSNYKK